MKERTMSEKPEKPGKRFFAGHAKSSAMVVSLAIHAIFIVVALSFVAVKVIIKEEPAFVAKKVKRPKMPPKKIRVPVNVKKRKPKPRLRKRIVVNTKTFTDIKMPEISGIKGGLGNMGGDGLGSLGFDIDMDLFGSNQSMGNELTGTFYDLKQTDDRKSTNMTIGKYDNKVKNFLSGWKENTFKNYFQAPKKKYATAIAMPFMQATEAPKAFDVADIVGPALWVIHYQGRFAAPETGKYRFCGLGNDLMFVRVKNRLVLDASWYKPGNFTHVAGRLSGWHSDDENNRKFRLAERSGLMAIGDWIKLTKGEAVDLEVLIGERAGSGFCSLLLIEQQDKTYKMVPTKNGPRPVLPIFKLAEIPDKLGSKMKLDPNEATLEGSVFGVLEQTP